MYSFYYHCHCSLADVLQGINLDQLRLEKDDVVIKIGKSECNITSTGRQLTCRPPREPPSPMKSGRYPEVEVSHTVWSVNGALDTGRFLRMIHVFYIFLVDLKFLYVFGHISKIIQSVVYHQIFIQYTIFFRILFVLWKLYGKLYFMYTNRNQCNKQPVIA